MYHKEANNHQSLFASKKSRQEKRRKQLKGKKSRQQCMKIVVRPAYSCVSQKCQKIYKTQWQYTQYNELDWIKCFTQKSFRPIALAAK